MIAVLPVKSGIGSGIGWYGFWVGSESVVSFCCDLARLLGNPCSHGCEATIVF
jgi:hypothetical protein